MASSRAEREPDLSPLPHRPAPAHPRLTSQPCISAWVCTLTVSPQMGALVGPEVTEVTALEFWSFASSDVVLLGRKGQESEGGGPACCSPLPASPVLNLSRGG